jgi:hypothetical protein
MNEIWKVVSTHSNYEVSSMGNVRNIVTQKNLIQNKDSSGYLSVVLSKNNLPKKIVVHRLVGLYFLENPCNKKTINHKNKLRNDNRVENLEWSTMKEQNIHKNKDNDKTIKKKINICSIKPIWRINKNTEEKIERYDNLTLAQEWCIKNKLTTSVNAKGGISQAALGLRSCALGYKWEYENYQEFIENEMWKDIPLSITNGKEGMQISSEGRIKYKNGYIGSGFEYGGYLGISIVGKIFKLHRIVAITFLENAEDKKIVNHKDGNKLNARLSNLEWVTPSENSIHAYENGLNDNVKAVIQFDIKMNKLNEFKSINSASRELKIRNTSIGNCCKGRLKTAGGYRFLFKDDYDENKNYNEGFAPNVKIHKIIQFDKNMHKIAEYISAKEASNFLKIKSGCILDCCHKKQQTAGGFRFMFDKDYNEKKVYDDVKYKSKAIKIIQLSLDGSEIKTFDSITCAADELEINDANISYCCKGKRKTAKGFKFMYYNDYLSSINIDAKLI